MRLSDENVTIEAGGEERIRQALDALEKDPHAPREVSLKFTLHIHNEYPKHVTVGKDKDEAPVTKIANSAEEENALLAAAKEE